MNKEWNDKIIVKTIMLNISIIIIGKPILCISH